MSDNRTTELKTLSKLKIAGRLRYWRGTIEIPEGELHAICDEIQAEHEQAIAATLGHGTCRMIFVDEYETASGDETYLCECSECGYRRWELACDLPLFCSKCGRKVKQ